MCWGVFPKPGCVIKQAVAPFIITCRSMSGESRSPVRLAVVGTDTVNLSYHPVPGIYFWRVVEEFQAPGVSNNTLCTSGLVDDVMFSQSGIDN